MSFQPVLKGQQLPSRRLKAAVDTVLHRELEERAGGVLKPPRMQVAAKCEVEAMTKAERLARTEGGLP